MEWQELNVTFVPMDFMDIMMVAVHLVTVRIHRITATPRPESVSVPLTHMGQSANSAMPTTGAMILSLDVWNATAVQMGLPFSSVTSLLASVCAGRSLLDRLAILVYLDTEITPTASPVTVM
ncbi:unnamed protein product [Staurois parvus]|uniref:Uncharacterized protein n=1 Tax=Staurois parvus TaxID=386267 RepID=A0ABN9FV10_9NEOB|nr:unnamed protein product [Staurois parvus]